MERNLSFSRLMRTLKVKLDIFIEWELMQCAKLTHIGFNLVVCCSWNISLKSNMRISLNKNISPNSPEVDMQMSKMATNIVVPSN